MFTGTAMMSDYSSSPTTFIFPMGSTPGSTVCLDITIIDDPDTEDNETLTVNFNVQVIGDYPQVGNTVAAITIINDDCKLYNK